MRLEVSHKEYYDGGFIVFQFHTGAIRSTTESKITESPLPSFNSILVRLEADNRSAVGYNEKFQFHTGAIRSAIKFRVDKAGYKFQFHTGAIRSKCC